MLRNILPNEGVCDALLKYRQHSKYNKKVIDVICSGSSRYSYDETIVFLDKLYKDIHTDIDVLWEKVPPSIQETYAGNKEELLKRLGLL